MYALDSVGPEGFVALGGLGVAAVVVLLGGRFWANKMASGRARDWGAGRRARGPRDDADVGRGIPGPPKRPRAEAASTDRASRVLAHWRRMAYRVMGEDAEAVYRPAGARSRLCVSSTGSGCSGPWAAWPLSECSDCALYRAELEEADRDPVDEAASPGGGPSLQPAQQGPGSAGSEPQADAGSTADVGLRV